MTNYNDGKIHGWNGGNCPVHPETEVEYWIRDGGPDTIKAEWLWWSHETSGSDVIAFRVVKEYVEPKVIWVNEYTDGEHMAFETEADARGRTGKDTTRIAVKYVEAIADAKECKE